MNIKFKGKYKSIGEFEWLDIPQFVVITGPNGSGKSQILELINSNLTGFPQMIGGLEFENIKISPDEVTFLKGEWHLKDTTYTSLSTIEQRIQGYYNHFISSNSNPRNANEKNVYFACHRVLKKSGKTHKSLLTFAEFSHYFPEVFFSMESEFSQLMGDLFFNYRLSEIELLAKNYSHEDIKKQIGEKPWVILRDIVNESKLPFSFNDPSEMGFRDKFKLVLIDNVTKDEVNFNNLSSGEKVLFSLLIFLYNSQEKNSFPKILLLDEPDAHLHPSMTQHFLNVLKNVLVDKFGVRVIMTTHSPSTVILSPLESLFEMSKEAPRLRPSNSKNSTVSLLTAGIVFVGEGTKYFLVEDKDDADFYSYIFKQLVSNKFITGDIPLVFIPASTKDNSGGKNLVENWVEKLQSSGLENIVQGIIDSDYGNVTSKSVYKIPRYSIENYLTDPIVLYAALIDKERQFPIDGISLSVGEEYKLKFLENESLQLIVDELIKKVDPLLNNYFENFDPNLENERVIVEFNNGTKLIYPKWLLYRRGKTILQNIYNEIFSSTIINYTTLFKAFRKLNLIPMEVINLFEEVRNPK